MYNIAKIDEVGLLAPPFADEPAAVDESRRLWLGRDMLDRGVLDRWVVLLTLFSGSFAATTAYTDQSKLLDVLQYACAFGWA